jgi:hypothetical protein
VILDERGYNREAWIALPRRSTVMILVPSGDTLWLSNVVDTLRTPGARWAPDCDSLVNAVRVSHLRVAVNQRPVVDFPVRERGQVSLTPNFRVPLPGGDVLVVHEVYRRKTICGMTDGFLLVWAVILSPP